MKNILIAILGLTTIASLSLAGYTAYESEKKDTSSTDNSKTVSAYTPNFKIDTDWNKLSSQSVNNLDDAGVFEGWAGMFDGEYIEEAAYYDGFKSFKIFMQSFGPTGFGIPSCYDSDLVAGKKYIAVQSIIIDDNQPTIQFLDRTSNFLPGDEGFDVLRDQYLEINPELENITYCQNNSLIQVEAKDLINASNGDSIDSLYVSQIYSPNPFSYAEEILDQLDTIEGIQNVEID